MICYSFIPVKFTDEEKLVTDRRMDRPTDAGTNQPTDTPSNRDAWTHLKKGTRGREGECPKIRKKRRGRNERMRRSESLD